MADSMGYKSAYCRFDNIPAGEGNINVDPLLNEDYSLSDCSPCIGAGTISFDFNDTTYNAPDIDYSYNTRPQPNGSNPDMGAFENALGSSVGLNDMLQLPENLIIYPNPAQDVLNIQFEDKNFGAVLFIYDIHGKTVICKKIQQETLKINIGNLIPGVYILRLNFNQSFLTKKLIVH